MIVIYDRNSFIIQATDQLVIFHQKLKLFFSEGSLEFWPKEMAISKQVSIL
jgi:hypothetical protein